MKLSAQEFFNLIQKECDTLSPTFQKEFLSNVIFVAGGKEYEVEQVRGVRQVVVNLKEVTP